MASDPKVKLLCSFGGKILPRPGDSALRYAGGHTRILSLWRSATLADLLAKIGQIVAGPVTVKYQLPDEELDALISITTDEDLDNMMEEFDRIADASGPDGSARMRIFLFSQADVDSSSEAAAGTDTGQIYVDAINGIGLLPRRDSLLSASSNEGMPPSTMSPSNGSSTQDPARSGLGLLGDETLAPTSSRVVEPLPLPQQQQAQGFNPPQNAVNFVNMAAAQQFAYPIYSGNAALMIPVAGNIASTLEHLVVAGDNVNVIEGNLRPNQGKVEAFVEESLYRSDQSSNNEIDNSGNGNVNGNGGNKDISQQSLSQLPLLHPTHFQQPQCAYIPSLMRCPQLALRLDDCQMCQRALLHAHSDTVINNSHANGNGNGSGSNTIHEVRPVLQSCHSEDPKRLQASLRPESAAVEPKVESAAVVPGQFSCQSENERAFHPNVEALDHVKVLHPNGVTGVVDLSSLHAPPRVVNGVMVDSEAKVDTIPTGGQSAASGFTEEIVHPHDKERLLHSNLEAFDPAKVLHPHNTVSGALADNVMESMVDNMAASAQFASYGFTQIPRMLQPHDNDRLLVHSNMPSVVGLPVDLQTSYAMVANPSQCYLPDPFQPLLQNMAPPCHLDKQDVATRQNVSAVKNGNYHATEPPNRVSVPEIPYDYARPINGIMERLCVSTIRPLGTTEHQIAAAAVNGGLPMLKLENSTLLLENNHVFRPHVGGNSVSLGNSHFMSGVASKENYTKPIHKPPPPSTDLVPEHPAVSADNAQVFRSQAGGNALYLGNVFIASGIVPEGNSIRPIHEAPPLLEFSCLQSLQPSEISKASNMMANQGTLISHNQEVRIKPEVPNERLPLMPTYSCGTTAAYTNMNAINVVPVGGQKDEASWFYSNDTVDNAAVPLNSTAPVHCSNSGGSNVHVEQFQGPTPLNSLFCNQDPQKIMGSVQMVPPRMNKLPSKEFVAPKDVSTENHSVNIKGSDVAVHAEESGFHHIQNSTNKDPCMGPVWFTQGEDHSKQEVQGLAEQVAAPVLQPSVPPAPVTFPCERTGADLPSNKESGLGETIAVVQSTAAIADHKTEAVTTKQADNTNFGFPIKDGIGCLQIIKNSDLEELRELGSGTFGTVYHGKWRGSDVAIKRINNRCFAGELSELQPMRDDFWNEARKLADMHHPNVVAFYGVVLDGPGGTVATVTEFMVNGSLRRALQKNDKSLDRRKRLLIAMDVAFGMEYLHGKNIIHFDLKSDNLLVNLRDPQRPICKVADLGLSKVKCQTLISGGVRGTLPWMAPELLNGNSTLVSDKVDVFSFGIVMWELLTGEEPYADLHYGAIIGGIVSNTLRPPVPESCDSEWRSLMEHCWSPEPSERPNFTEIASRLRSMAASYPQK